MTCTTTDLQEFLRTRRSVRRFKPDAVPGSVIERILSTATHAPSAHNRQPWRFVVLQDPAVRARVAQAMAEDFERDLLRDGVAPESIQAQTTRSRDRIGAAPAVILLCLDMSEMDTYTDDGRQQTERSMAVQSVAAAGLQLLLAAHAEGLGGVWVCSPLFAPQAIQRTLAMPATWEPQAMFFIGYAARLPEPRERIPVDRISLIF